MTLFLLFPSHHLNLSFMIRLARWLDLPDQVPLFTSFVTLGMCTEPA